MHALLAVLSIDQIFGGGLMGHIVVAALTVGCGVVMLACGQATLAWKCANLVQMLLEASAGASAIAGASGSPVLSTTSSALHAGPGPVTSGRLSSGSTVPSVPAVPGTAPIGPVVPQRAPEVDQEGMP